MGKFREKASAAGQSQTDSGDDADTTEEVDLNKTPVVVDGDPLVEGSTDGQVLGQANDPPVPVVAAGLNPPDPPVNTVTLQAPPNAGKHLTYQGVKLNIVNGLVTVEHHVAKHLREAFGFTDAPPEKQNQDD